MRAIFHAVIVLLVIGNAGRALASEEPKAEPRQATSVAGSAIIIDPVFQQVVKELLAASPTLRAQYERITSAARVRVWVQPVFGRPGNTAARATISRSESGLLLAQVEITTPLRMFEYAEMLAHEFEHVLEQIEGVRLTDLADRARAGASKLFDGAFETERARRAGRAAAAEVQHNLP